jgi:hypothetical protein
MSRKTQHHCYGAADRFEVLAGYIYDCYGGQVRYIADVAGGQGLLARILNKRYNYECEVVDPRGWVLKGVPSRSEIFQPERAVFYDLVVGLHPDEATRAVAQAALVRPTILVPCCNFWSEEKLGRNELLEAIEMYYREQGVSYERVVFPFKGPKNIGLVTQAPT